jgi:hypothetical protein
MNLEAARSYAKNKLFHKALPILCGLMRQQMPNKATYPWPSGGHVLVNCRGGRSRSVVLVSLFLHVQRPASFATLDAAIAHVREMRQLDPVEWPSAPKPVLIEAAQWAAREAADAVLLFAVGAGGV